MIMQLDGYNLPHPIFLQFRIVELSRNEQVIVEYGQYWCNKANSKDNEHATIRHINKFEQIFQLRNQKGNSSATYDIEKNEY